MPAAPTPRRCPACAAGVAEAPNRMYGGGPFLIVNGSGVGSEDTAHHAGQQCGDHGVEALVRAIDDVGDLDLVWFLGLVLSLPSELSRDPAAALRPFSDLVLSYRARRRPGLRAILDGTRRWYEVGIVELLGPRALLDHPAMHTARSRACAHHYTDGGAPAEIFHPFAQGVALVPEPARALDASAREALRKADANVRSWGITSLANAEKVYDCIDSMRHYYENPRKSQQHRPISGYSRNRLDIILDGPHDVVIGSQKTWNENGASVWREVKKAIDRLDIGMARPKENANARGAVKDLTYLYRDLNIVISYGRATGQQDGPLLS